MKMNLAEAAAGLARKEVEKKQANEDILRLEVGTFRLIIDRRYTVLIDRFD